MIFFYSKTIIIIIIFFKWNHYIFFFFVIIFLKDIKMNSKKILHNIFINAIRFIIMKIIIHFKLRLFMNNLNLKTVVIL